MGIFRKQQNKKFNYRSRFYENENEGSPFDIKHKFEEHRKTDNPPGGLKTRFVAAFDELKNPTEKRVRIRLLIIIAILLLIFLYIIDFDLTIFKQVSL